MDFVVVFSFDYQQSDDARFYMCSRVFEVEKTIIFSNRFFHISIVWPPMITYFFGKNFALHWYFISSLLCPELEQLIPSSNKQKRLLWNLWPKSQISTAWKWDFWTDLSMVTEVKKVYFYKLNTIEAKNRKKIKFELQKSISKFGYPGWSRQRHGLTKRLMTKPIFLLN